VIANTTINEVRSSPLAGPKVLRRIALSGHFPHVSRKGRSPNPPNLLGNSTIAERREVWWLSGVRDPTASPVVCDSRR
jgi:hypothetical protein